MERIAKVLARHGIASRRQAEVLIEQGRVQINGAVLQTPAYGVQEHDLIYVDGKLLNPEPAPRLWMFYKPRGVLTTHYDPQGRPILFDLLPTTLPRVISVGRLDMMSEGLILLTNSGSLSRHLEHPSSNLERTYHVRVYGAVKQSALQGLAKGIEVEGITYGPIQAHIVQKSGANTWIQMSLWEGKNREIRKIMTFLGLQVNRLIRINYGPFALGSLQPQELMETDPLLIKSLPEKI